MKKKASIEKMICSLLICAMILPFSSTMNIKSREVKAYSKESKHEIWDGSIDTDWEGEGTKESPYLISSAAELAGVAANSENNSKKNYYGKYFKQTCDIWLNDIENYCEWEHSRDTLNVWSAIPYFYGDYDGDNNTIYGMYCNSTDQNGLFGSCEGAVIKNITVKESLICSEKANDVGGIVAYAKIWASSYYPSSAPPSRSSSIIDNCNYYGKICATGCDSVGGIVGTVVSSTNVKEISITNCNNYAEIIGGKSVGGIVGCASQDFNDTVISNCVNYGKLTGENYSSGSVGGIVGRQAGDDEGKITIEKCANINDISGAMYVGGIVGYAYPKFSSKCQISQCYNTAKIKSIEANSYAGGIIGISYACVSGNTNIFNCYNLGSVTSEYYAGGIAGAYRHQGSYGAGPTNIRKSYNAGSISGKSTGGIITLTANSNFSDNYYIKGEYTAKNSAGMDLSASQMKDENNYNGFDFNAVWKMGTNSPIFLWQMGKEYVTDDTTVDDYMVGQVKKYTSDDLYTQYDRIMNSGNSVELKFKQLNDLFSNNGLVDAKEGIEYLSNTTSHRNSYRYLTTNEIYCAFNFWNWLYSDSGTLARGLLYADGLIFNGEVFDYADVSTYSENDYPGVKKNKAMLKQFMSCDAPQVEVFDNANRTVKYLKNILKLNNIAETHEMETLMDKILICESEEELKKLQTKFVNDYITPQGMDKIYLNGEPFAEALGYASGFISFAGATTDDILGILNLSNEIETYEKYRDFLTTIYECKDVSFEMRLAAYSLLDEIKNGYMNKLKSILLNGISLANGIMEIDKTIFKELVGKGGEISLDSLGTIKLATFISNIVVDTGDFVKQAAYTQGYAELATLYSLKLKEDKIRFQGAQTSANAWKFFEDYTMLWALRYQGEQQYLEMNTIKMYLFAKVKSFKYDMKEEVVKETLSQLNIRKFEVSDEYTVPESIMYNKKAVINCPVDVKIYTKDGTLVASLQDGVESDFTNEYGRFTVVYQPYSGEYAKVICQSTDEELVIKATAISDGLVDWQMSTNEDGKCVAYGFDKVQVAKGDVIETTSNISEKSTYSIKKNGEQEAIYKFVLQKTDHYVAVENLIVKSNSMIMDIGDSEVIGVSVLPTNATNKDVIWSSSDEEVVTIKNGVITAKKVGEAIICVNSMESANIQEEISVTVQNISNDVVSTPTSTPSSTVEPTAKPFTDDSTQVSSKSDSQKETEDISIKVGNIVTQKKMKYKITKIESNGSREVSLIGTKKRKNDKKFRSLKVENSIKIGSKVFKVTSIGSRAFTGYKYLKKITIGKNVIKIEKKAFFNCKRVKKILICSTKLNFVGGKTISRINKRADIKVPKKKLKKYKKLFKTKTGYKRTMNIQK